MVADSEWVILQKLITGGTWLLQFWGSLNKSVVTIKGIPMNSETVVTCSFYSKIVCNESELKLSSLQNVTTFFCNGLITNGSVSVLQEQPKDTSTILVCAYWCDTDQMLLQYWFSSDICGKGTVLIQKIFLAVIVFVMFVLTGLYIYHRKLQNDVSCKLTMFTLYAY